MEAPKKIYIQPNIGGRELIKTWFPVKIDQESIEYVRKDAFVEKACKYLKSNRENVKTEDNGIAGWIEDEFIEDFKNYMED